MSEDNKLEKSKFSSLPLLLLIFTVVGVAIFFAFYLKKDGALPGINDGGKKSKFLLDDHDYLVYLSRIEVLPTKEDGKNWDVDKSAPDLFYEMSWQGNKVYKSEKQENLLIGVWIPVSLDLMKAIKSQKISFSDAIRIPILRYNSKNPPTSLFSVVVYDNDVAQNDLIGNLSFDLSTLKPGDNEFSYADKSAGRVLAVTVRVIDSNLDMGQKLDLLTNGN